MADPNLIPPPPAGYTVGGQTGPIPPPPPGYTIGPGNDASPMAQFLQGSGEPKDDPNRLPYVGQQAIGSLPTDPDAKINYFSKILFPGESQKYAASRFGIHNGRIFYVDDKGTGYYAEPPSFPWQIGPIKQTGDPAAFGRSIPNYLASNVGPSMSTIGGIGGGAATAEIAGGIPGAAAGGFVADSWRQMLANWLTGENKTPTQRLLQAGGEGLEQGAGQVAGHVISGGAGMLFNRNPLRVGGYDAGQLTPQRIADMQANADLASQMGVTVTPGEAGNVRSLLNNQRQLFRQPESSTPLSDFYAQRNTQQIPGAWEQVMMGISPQNSPGLGARNLAEGADAAITKAVMDRSNAAKPLYNQTVSGSNVMSSHDFNNLVGSNPLFSQGLNAVRSDPLMSARIDGMPDSSLAVWDRVKRYYDGIAGEAERAGNADKASLASSAANDLRTQLDQIFPGYQAARDAYAGKSPAVDELNEGLTGLVAKDRAQGWQNAPNTMFGASSADPLSITVAKNAFAKAGKSEDWNAGVRSFLENAFSNAAKQDQGPAASIYRNLKADSRQWNNLKAALDPDQLQALDNFMKVAEMVKRAPAEGSPTATDLTARTSFAGPVSRAATKLGNLADPLEYGRIFNNWVVNLSAGKNAAQLAQIITSPDAIASLRKLRVMKPGTKAFVTEMGNLATTLTGSSMFPNLPPDQAPGYMGATQ